MGDYVPGMLPVDRPRCLMGVGKPDDIGAGRARDRHGGLRAAQPVGADRAGVDAVGEIIAPMLLTWHNLHYFQELMQNLRDSVAAGRLASFAGVFRGMQARGDVEPL